MKYYCAYLRYQQRDPHEHPAPTAHAACAAMCSARLVHAVSNALCAFLRVGIQRHVLFGFRQVPQLPSARRLGARAHAIDIVIPQRAAMSEDDDPARARHAREFGKGHVESPHVGEHADARDRGEVLVPERRRRLRENGRGGCWGTREKNANGSSSSRFAISKREYRPLRAQTCSDSTHFGVSTGGTVDIAGFASFACRGRTTPRYKPAPVIGAERHPPAVRVS